MDMSVIHKTKRELTVFFTVTFLLSWLFWLIALMEQTHRISMSFSCDLLLNAGSFGPSVTGIILAYIFGGKTELLSLLKSMIDIRSRLKWLI
jgi:hypothetical protein